MTAGFADLTLTLDEVRAWLETSLAGPKVYTDGAPSQPVGAYVVLNVVNQPRTGAPLAGLTDAGFTFQATSVAWDPVKKRSPAAQARYLGGKVCAVIARTTTAGAPFVAHPALTGLHVQQRTTEGDGRAEKVGDLWQWPETFRLDVSAA